MNPLPASGVLPEEGGFLLRIAVHQMDPARCVKALVDGAMRLCTVRSPAA
jgi:hypothetical protein